MEDTVSLEGTVEADIHGSRNVGRPLATGSRVKRNVSIGILLFLILSVASALRCYRLGSLFPILVDEGIYLRWAEIVHHQQQWFIATLDAKQPLCSWIYATLRIFAPGDPLIQARAVSVFAGVLSTFLLFRLSRQLAGTLAGLASAALYAVAPYGVFFDRVAYTEGVLNALTIAAVCSVVHSFRDAKPSFVHAASAGLWLGLAFFCKSPALPFAAIPAIICFFYSRDRWKLLLVTYAVAAIFPAILFWSAPSAPVSPTNHFFLHQLNYFAAPSALMQSPFTHLKGNSRLLFQYLRVYLTLPLVLATAVSWVVLIRKKAGLPCAILSFVGLILIGEIIALEYFPSRYAFPYLWPCFVVVGCAAGHLKDRAKLVAALYFCLVLGGMAVQSVEILRAPRQHLHPEDATAFLTANPYAGFGVNEAVRFIEGTASEQGPLVLLTDPIWGLPADPMFVYLNLHHGIEVHEAWWEEISEDYPLVPAGRTALMKSHYERIYGGNMDFNNVRHILYVTDSAYFTADDVRRRQATARLLASFYKPGNTESIDVYDLK
jgi:hypothetical protein